MQRKIAVLLVCVVAVLATTACRPPNNSEFVLAMTTLSSVKNIEN
ncbi:hypothetical protein [Lysobacter enzymogenes]|nr:hypothetical protein [Lysobacter enzymogenes]